MLYTHGKCLGSFGVMQCHSGDFEQFYAILVLFWEVAPAPTPTVARPQALFQAAPQQQVHEGELNRIEAPENQSRISKCGICEKMMNTNKLQRHMEENHVELVEEQLEPQCILVEEEPEQVLEGSGQAEEDPQEEPHQEHREVGEPEQRAEAEQGEKTEKVVMVKRKTLWWPAKVVGKSNQNMTVNILNKNNTEIKVNMINVKKFNVDHSQMAGMTREWRDAYIKAVDIVAEEVD